MSSARAADIAFLLDAYLQADYRWQSQGHWHRIAVGARAPGVDAAFPDAARFALLSAWNPGSVARDDARNRAEDAALRRTIDDAGLRCQPAFSSARDRSWREPGWLVLDLGPSALDALARRFGQLGTLAWKRGEAVRLRMDAAAPPGLGATPAVDWLK